MNKQLLYLGLATALLLASSCASKGRSSSDLNNAQAEDQLSPREAAEASYVIARDLQKEGIYDIAAQHYRNAREFYPEMEGIARNLAVIYDRLGQTSRAQTEYEKALKEEPRSSSLQNDYGYFNYARGRLDDAERSFRRSLELDSDNERARINLGLTLARQRRDAEALDAFRMVVTEAEAHSNLAMVQTQRGDYDLAEENFERALKIDPMLKPATAAILWLEDYRAGRAVGDFPGDTGEAAPSPRS